MNKRVSVIIPWCNRFELAQTLTNHASVFAACCSEVLVINAGGDASRLRDLLHNISHKVRQIDIPCQYFNKSLCLNIGAFCSNDNAEYIVNLDADVLIDDAVYYKCLESITEGCYVNISRLHETGSDMQPSHKPKSFLHKRILTEQYVFADGRTASYEFNVWCDGGRSCLGLIFVRKEDFIKIHGANSNLKGWGFEDIDIQLRLQLALGLQRIGIGEVTHISHSDEYRDVIDARNEGDHIVNDKKRGRLYTNNRNKMICLNNYMRGNLYGTYYQDIARWGAVLRETT
jgi:predicted glycosyltransferase involved in capsule biosynthesis